ncbi:MAG: GGDEF domain-containing protein [Armatimonadota bacterium]|nr:GGDEF domain-containing protein [Armatimonadota bacterium]
MGAGAGHTVAYRLYAAVWFGVGCAIAVAAVPRVVRLEPSYLFFLALSAVGNLIVVRLAGGVLYTMQGAVALAAAWLYGWPVLVPINLLSTVILLATQRASLWRGMLYFGNATVTMSAAAGVFKRLVTGPLEITTSWGDAAALLLCGGLFAASSALVAGVGRYLDTGDRAHVTPSRWAYLTVFALVFYVPSSYLMVAAFLAGRGGSALTVAVWLLASLAIKGFVEMREANTRLEEAMQALHEASITDALTGLFNRRHFNERLEDEFQRAARYGQPLSVLIADLRGLKRVNDTMGHAAGDEVLRQVASALRQAIRTTDLAFRIGGDEFAFVVPSTDAHGAAALADALAAEIRQTPIHVGDAVIRVAMTVGSATYPQDGATPGQLVLAADTAMYRAREWAARPPVQTDLAAPGPTPAADPPLHPWGQEPAP